jgi:hypothetical protein
VSAVHVLIVRFCSISSCKNECYVPSRPRAEFLTDLTSCSSKDVLIRLR